MISCLIAIIMWLIVALSIIYVIEAVAPLPPTIMILIRLLVGLLILLASLDCLGVLDVGFPTLRGLR